MLLQKGELRRQRVPVDGNARPGHDDKLNLAQERGSFMPGWQGIKHVGPDEPVHILPAVAFELPNRIDGVAGLIGAGNFDVGNLEMNPRTRAVRFDCKSAHVQAMRRVGQVRNIRLVWGLSGWDQQNPVEPPAFGHRAGANEVPMVDWIETSSEAQRFLMHGGCAGNLRLSAPGNVTRIVT